MKMYTDSVITANGIFCVFQQGIDRTGLEAPRNVVY